MTDTSATAAPQEGEASNKAKGEVSIKLFARTDVGQVREHNEDNFLVADLTKRQRGLQEANRVVSVGKNGNLLAVCDGMGGAAAGEVASKLAVDIIYEKMTEGCSPDVQATRNDIARRLVNAVEAAGLPHLRGSQERPHAPWHGHDGHGGRAHGRPSLPRSGRRLARLHPAQRHARAGHPRPVARQPAHRGRPAHRRRGRDLRAQQHHPPGARDGGDRAGRPHVRRAATGRCADALLGWSLGDGPQRRDPRGARRPRPIPSRLARR